MAPKKKRQKLRTHHSEDGDEDNRKPAAVETNDEDGRKHPAIETEDEDDSRQASFETDDRDEDYVDTDDGDDSGTYGDKDYLPTSLHSDGSASLEGSTKRHINQILKQTEKHPYHTNAHYVKNMMKHHVVLVAANHRLTQCGIKDNFKIV